MQKKHPEVIRKGNSLDFRDILEDPLLQFYNRQQSHYISLLVNGASEANLMKKLNHIAGPDPKTYIKSINNYRTFLNSKPSFGI